MLTRAIFPNFAIIKVYGDVGGQTQSSSSKKGLIQILNNV